MPLASEEEILHHREREVGSASNTMTSSSSSSGSKLVASGSREISGESTPKEDALVHDYVVRRHVLEAMSAGIPKLEVQKWVIDCSRNFFVQDDRTFELAWFELRRCWEAKNKRRKRRALDPFKADREEMHSKMPRTCLTMQARIEMKICAELAHQDVQSGCCTSVEQGLAVRLAMAFGCDAPGVWVEAYAETQSLADGAELRPDPGDSEAADDAAHLKRLLLLVHPDKTSHPLAKQAFQKLAPLLRFPAQPKP
mmetsp:Transcript_12657/g.20985  ORF Transcript_12657/g.20985 Transcript_12657/m.20985 type:complete len:254 (+) Transcript_12657:42-803(+)